ncbi:TonB-dependent receptor [Roseateles sp. DAIF2]|uniref:TonB-dependent receptor n=1 Tax=Roseateles sp. DAIF2 TaxID=2714952 RepID=UPI0018A2D533|nr:TonB-dependent receptor [Roseateles sp. DAIF2]QPF76166.1 TonB-dependent receptor [Roseateles sp. DAIF2]
MKPRYLALPPQGKRPLLVLCLAAGAAAADEPTAGARLDAVQVHGSRSPGQLDPDLPSTLVGKSAEALLEQQNVFNPEDALRNLPNLTLRKRYSGDRNALLAGRSFSSLQAQRALVQMDGYLLSNFLYRFDAPRWNMIAPEEIERVDVAYGPFSALYAGNSMGVTVLMQTSRPRSAFEGALRLAGQSQSFDLYDDAGRYGNSQASALLGGRLESGSWWRLLLNRQQSTSQPQQYYVVLADAQGRFPTPSGPGMALPVQGIRYDIAPNGRRRAVFGANAGAIDRTLQHTAKLSAGHDFSPSLGVDGFLAWWRNDSHTSNRSFLRDAAGRTVWSGRVRDAGDATAQFDIPAQAFAPYSRDEAHLQGGLSLRTRHARGWNLLLQSSVYRVREDIQRDAAAPDPQAAAGGPGQAATRDGTGFDNLEAQARYTPSAGDWGGGAHALTLGLQDQRFRLRQRGLALADWRGGAPGALLSEVGGRSRLLALYAQDAWRFAPDWRLVSGLRWEAWRARDGLQSFAGIAPVQYAERRLEAWSPKLSLSWDAAPDLSLRVSAGRGVRFPTVSELFAGTRSGSKIERSDPQLRPERSDALELSAERRFAQGQLRASLFQDDVRDTIWNQLNPTLFPIVSTTQNVGRVRTRGLELAGEWHDWPLRGLSLEGHVAFNRATILENAALPASVGKHWLRVPRVRSALTLSYQPERAWTWSATYRHSGRQYNELDNSDLQPDRYGGVSSYGQLDLRLLWRGLPGLELALGVDNVGNQLAFQAHPYPGRSLFAEVRHVF